jgi:hypothetical protein
MVRVIGRTWSYPGSDHGACHRLRGEMMRQNGKWKETRTAMDLVRKRIDIYIVVVVVVDVVVDVVDDMCKGDMLLW